MLTALIFALIAHGEVSSTAPGGGPVPAAGAPNICRELREGESLRVEQFAAQSATGLGRTYRISRDANDPQLFIVEFNLQFAALEDAIVEQFGSQLDGVDRTVKGALQPFSDQIRTEFVRRTRQCFYTMRNRIRAHNGQRLELRLDYPTPQDPDSPPESYIRIQSQSVRSSSTTWSRSIDCNTIVHEVLHLTGLCDGYSESLLTVQVAHPDGGTASLYSCRSIEPEDSIMRDQSGLNVTFEVLRCTQSPRQAARPVSTAANPLPTTCSSGSTPKKMLMGRSEFNAMVAAENNRRRTGLTKTALPRESVYFFHRELPAASMLYPAQMRLITQPFCTSTNQRYIECAQNARRTREVEGCAIVPDYCQTFDYLQ